MSDHTDYDRYVSSGTSLRQIIFRLLQENKDLTPSQIIGILRLSYGVQHPKRQTIANYIQEWKARNLFQARPLRPHRRVFRWFVERSEDGERKALAAGWRFASNRNRMLVYKYDYGSVHWHVTGNVFVNLRGLASLARAKETFSRAFWDVIGSKEVNRCVDAPIRELGRQMVFDLGQPLPRFEIRHYEKSHGLRIYSNGSHPTAIEVAETEPFWLTHLEEVVTNLGENIKEHLRLITAWRKESETRQHLFELEQQRSERVEQNLQKLQETTAINTKVTLTLASLLARRRRRKPPKKPSRLQRIFGFLKKI